MLYWDQVEIHNTKVHAYPFFDGISVLLLM